MYFTRNTLYPATNLFLLIKQAKQVNFSLYKSLKNRCSIYTVTHNKWFVKPFQYCQFFDSYMCIKYKEVQYDKIWQEVFKIEQ